MSDHYCCKHCGQRYDLCKCPIPPLNVVEFKPKISANTEVTPSNLIDFSTHKKKRDEAKAKLYDANELQCMTNAEMIEDWLGMLEHCMEEDYDLKIGGPKIESMFKAVESILHAVLIGYDNGSNKKA